MKRNNTYRICAFASLISVMFLSGCGTSSESPLELSIPADAVVVKKFDFLQMFKEAGTPEPFAPDGTMTQGASSVMALCVEPEFRQAFTSILKAAGYADLGSVVSFTTQNGRDLMLLGLHSSDAFINTVDNGQGAKMENGYLTTRSGDMILAVRDNKCWIGRSLDDIENAVRSAAASHIGTMPGIRDFMATDAAANIAINCGNSSLSFLGGKDKWFCASMKLTEQSASAWGMVMDRDGKTEPIGEAFQTIDTDFLRYTPADAAVVLAFGKFSGNVRALSFLLGRFAPVYLKDASGTTSLYALPAGSAKAVAAHAPGSWNVETMVKLPQDILNEGLVEYQTGSGHPVTKLGNQWTYADGDCRYYFGAFDGALVFSTNREISSDYNNSFTEDFLGKRAAMTINIPEGSVLCDAWNLPCGLTFKITVESMEWKARISFYGNRASAFATLLTLPQLEDYRARFANATAL